jgi:hypothetical protein
VEWLDEVQRSLPSVVFAAHTPQGDVLDVRVSVDGTGVTTHLDGMAMEIDPGVHKIRFELADRPPIEMTVVLVEGQKNRVVEATWRDEPPPAPAPAPPTPASAPSSPVPPSSPPGPSGAPAASLGPAPAGSDAPVEMVRPVPTVTYVLGAVGVAGVAGFTAFALVGQSKKSNLDTTCAPFCTSSDLSPSKTAFAVADASLAIAFLAFASAGVAYFTRPEVPRAAPQHAAWNLSVAPGGARVDWRIAF